jgi:hypothetical protein
MAGVSVGIGDVGTGGAPPMGADNELGSLLGEAFDSATGEESLEAGGEAPAGEAGSEGSQQPFESPAESPAGESPTVQADAATADTPWKLAPDGQSYMMPKAELNRVQGALKYSDAVGQIFANPMEAQAAAAQASDMRTMFNDWNFGTDDALKSVMSHLAGSNHTDPTTRAAYQRSFTKMAQMAPDMLRSINPQAYSQLVAGMGKSLTSQMYEKAAQSQNPQDLLDAQSMDWALTGQYQKELPKADPAAQQRTQFEQQQREFYGRQQAALTRDIQAFNNQAVEYGPTGKIGRLESRIDQVLATSTGGDLAKFKGKFGDVPYQDMKIAIVRETIDALAKTDWYTEHKQTYQQLMEDYKATWAQGFPGRGLQPRVQAYINDFLSHAQRVLPAIAQKRVNANTQARLSRSAPAPKPAGTSRPAPVPNNGQPTARMSSEQWDKEFAEALRV